MFFNDSSFTIHSNRNVIGEFSMSKPLSLNDVPAPDADFALINRFAHRINGYEMAGSLAEASNIAEDESKTDLRSLQIRLFFCARALRHSSDTFESAYMRDIVRQIREELQKENSKPSPD